MFLLLSTEAEKLSPIDRRKESRNGVGGRKRKRKQEKGEREREREKERERSVSPAPGRLVERTDTD